MKVDEGAVWVRDGRYRQIVDVVGDEVFWSDPSCQGPERRCLIATWRRWTRHAAPINPLRLRILSEIEARVVARHLLRTDRTRYRALRSLAVARRVPVWRLLLEERGIPDPGAV